MTDQNMLINPPSNTTTIEKFSSEVLAGLSSSPKRLFSKYFYDSYGDRLFQQIMAMPEYYLTKCELDIFSNQTAALAAAIDNDGSPFDLIELGAGDAKKSFYLLKYLVDQQTDFTYRPIDISGNILCELESKLLTEIPALDIESMEGEYFEALKNVANPSGRRKVILFLGGNIGNMELEEAAAFCSELRSYLNPGDRVLIGFDLKKNPQIILEAYNDPNGITAAFNLNLLTRINCELGANIDLEKFSHFQNYDPITGACRSYLISLTNQSVRIADKIIKFTANEPIFMEISQKFSPLQVAELAKESGFDQSYEITDPKGWFIDAIWTAK
jgi:L-histidine N-alpha-methyltransferase